MHTQLYLKIKRFFFSSFLKWKKNVRRRLQQLKEGRNRRRRRRKKIQRRMMETFSISFSIPFRFLPPFLRFVDFVKSWIHFAITLNRIRLVDERVCVSFVNHKVFDLILGNVLKLKQSTAQANQRRKKKRQPAKEYMNRHTTNKLEKRRGPSNVSIELHTTPTPLEYSVDFYRINL